MHSSESEQSSDDSVAGESAAMTRIGPAQCPILCCNFSMLMQQVRSVVPANLEKQFGEQDQLKGGKLLFLNRILTV